MNPNALLKNVAVLLLNMKEIFYKNPLSLTSQIFFCGLPLKLDSYLGCSFNCKYCFALNRGGKFYWNRIIPAKNDFLENIFKNLSSRSGKPGILTQFLLRKVPIHFGGMSDPFQPVEKKYLVTYDFLKTLQKNNYPTVLSTKSSYIKEPKYLDLIKNFENFVVQFSFSTLQDKKSSKIEPNSEPPSKLLESMEFLSKNGINVTCRWQPYVIDFSESPAEFVSLISATGAKHIGFEHLKIPLSSKRSSLWSSHENSLMENYNRKYLNLGGIINGREIILPIEAKIGTIQEVKRQCETKKMGFGCGDNELQYLSSSNCCCSGVDIFKGFENWYRYQMGYAIRQNISRKMISFDTLKNEWYPKGSIKMYLNSDSRIPNNNNSINDHIKLRWNSGKYNSPIMFHGVNSTNKFSRNGFRYYEWDKILLNK